MIAARDAKPCVFTSGPEKGYFGSLTALKNGLPARQRGECEVADQIDLRHVPGLVLRGGAANPLARYGARVGDLALAIDPATGVRVAAILADAGDAERIGEGSIALNMALLGRSAQPSNYAQASALDTGRRDIVVAVLPRTRAFALVRPYSAANIADRVSRWAQANGHGDVGRLAATAARCSAGL